MPPTSPRRSSKILPGRWTCGLICLVCCHFDPTADKQLKIDEWTDGQEITQQPEDPLSYLKMIVNHLSSLPKIAPVSGWSRESAAHIQTLTGKCLWVQTSLHTLTHTHAQIRQPGEVCVCARARQQLCVLLQQRTLTNPTNRNTWCVMWCCSAQTKQHKWTERERCSAASCLSSYHCRMFLLFWM